MDVCGCICDAKLFVNVGNVRALAQLSLEGQYCKIQYYF